jgi:hypothetical protein
MVSARIRAGLAGAVLTLCAAVASAQTTVPALTGTANGLNVSLSWTAVPLATGYELLLMYNGLGPVPVAVGNITTLSSDVPPGAYQIAVRATAAGIAGQPSNVVTLNVAAVPPPAPAAPTNLAAAVNGNAVTLTWDLATTSGLLGLGLNVGTTPGGSDIGTFPIRVSESTFLANVPNGNYFMRLFAAGPGGFSAESNELNVAVPSCSAPTTLPFTVSSNGGFIQAEWPAIPGASGYRLDAATAPGGGANLGSVPIPGNQTNFQVFGIPTGTYYLTLHVALSCGATASSAEQVLNVTAPVRLPAKSFNHATSMVLAAATSTAGVGSSCGNNTWLFRTLQKLRAQDDRFGLNWKRGVFGDMSQDVILYNFSDLPNEQAGAAHVYAWDVIGGHCGPSPRPQAGNITDARGRAGWTILYYQRAGFAP